MADWKTLLDGGDFPAALAACLRQFEGRANTFAAAQALAEVEERWGDWLVRSGLPGAAEHYSAAGKLLVSPNLLVNSVEESRLLVSILYLVFSVLFPLVEFSAGEKERRLLIMSARCEAPPTVLPAASSRQIGKKR
jgi:hypothetical protein